jgi:hypothetical protein
MDESIDSIPLSIILYASHGKRKDIKGMFIKTVLFLSKMVEIFCINLKNETIFILFKISVSFGFSG